MKTQLDLQLNGKHEFDGGWNGWIGDLVEYQCIQYNSSIDLYSRFNLMELEPSLVEITFTDKVKQGIVPPLKVGIENYQPGGAGTHWVGLIAGWHDFLDALESFLTNTDIVDRYEELCEVYYASLKTYYSVEL